MRHGRSAMLAMALTLAAMLPGCSESSEIAAEMEMGEADVGDAAISEDQAAESADLTGDAGQVRAPSAPQIAYSYSFGFRLPAEAIAQAQAAHVAQCNAVPQDGCRVLNMATSGGEGDYATGSLQLAVRAPLARAFGARLAETIDEAGGENIDTGITGEDLSKQIVDTEARLASRELLAQRLTELLRTRSGSVAELVEAERAVAQVNEEIDAARSWLAEMRGRVAFSDMAISYRSDGPGSGGFWRPIRESVGDVSSVFGTSIGAFIVVVAAVLPWLLLLAALIWLRTRFKSPDRGFWGRRRVPAAPREG